MSTNVFDESLITSWIEEILTALGAAPPKSDPDEKTVNLRDRGLVRADCEDFDEFRDLFRAFKETLDEDKARELATIGAKALCSFFPSALLPEIPNKRPLTSRDKDAVEVAGTFGVPFSEDTGYKVEAEDKDRVTKNFGRPTVRKVRIRRLLGSGKGCSDEYLRMIIRKSAEIIEQMPAMPVKREQ